MSGQVRGKIECVFNTGNRQSMTQVFFKNLYDFFSAHPNYTIIALEYGLTGSNVPGSTSSGTGTNYYDQALSFGYNAFFVTRANATAARPFDVYYLFQWAGSVNQAGANQSFGAALGPGNPGLVLNTNAPTDGNHTTVGWQAAIGIGGTGGSTLSPNNGNPWKGTQNGNGLDTKQQVGPIWGAPPGGGTGVMIFPRSNSGAFPQSPGAHVSKTQNCGWFYSRNTDTVQTRMNIVGDDDSFMVFIDDTDNGNYYFQGAGIYVPRPNVSQAIPYPFFALMNYNNLPLPVNDGNQNGDVAGTNTFNGGICMTTSGSVAGLSFDQWGNNFMQNDTNFHPDHQLPGTVYNEFPFWIGINETTPQNLSGYLGTTAFFKCMYNVPTNDTKSDFSRVFIGSTTLAQQKVSMPWDAQNNTVPRSGTTRQGVTFVTNLGGGL